MTAKKTEPAAPISTYTRRDRETGHEKTVGRAVDLKLDPTDGPWTTTCDEHKTAVMSATRRLAAAVSLLSFCEACRKEVKVREKEAAFAAAKPKGKAAAPEAATA